MNKIRYIVLFVITAQLASLAGQEKQAKLDFKQNKIKATINSNIHRVMVYPSSAIIYRKATCQFKIGSNKIIIENLPVAMDDESIRLYTADTSIQILNIHTELIAKTKFNSKELNQYLKKRESISIELRLLADKKLIVNNFLNLLRNIKIAPEDSEGKTISTDSWGNLIAFITKTSSSYLIEILDFEQKAERLKKEDKKLITKISLLKKVSVPATKNITAEVNSKNKKGILLFLEYKVKNVSWYMKNRYRINRQTQIFQLEQIAMLAQNTGEDWPACEIQFATRSPSASLTLPPLSIPVIENAKHKKSVEPLHVIKSDLKRKEYQLPKNLQPLREFTVHRNIIEKSKNISRAFQFPHLRPSFVSFNFGGLLGLEGSSPLRTYRGGGAKMRYGAGRAGSARRTESATETIGNKWLATQQEASGAWSHPSNNARLTNNTTCMVLLSFLGAGMTDKVGRYKRNVKKGLQYLINNPPTTDRIYENAIYLLALAEATGMGAGGANCKTATKKAFRKLSSLLQKNKSRLKNDVKLNLHPEGIASLVTATMAIKTTIVSGLFSGKREMKILKKICLKFRSPNNPPEICAGILLCIQYFGYSKHEPVAQALTKRILENKSAAIGNEWFMYWGNLAMFQQGGRSWKDWHQHLTKGLIKGRVKSGPDKGAVLADGKYGIDGRGGHLGLSQADVTAMHLLTLEVYYRYKSVIGSGTGGYRIKNSIPSELATLNEHMPLHFFASFEFSIPSRSSYLPIRLSSTQHKGTIFTEFSPLASDKAFDSIEFKNPLNHPLLSGETEIYVNDKRIGSYISPRVKEQDLVKTPLGINEGLSITKKVERSTVDSRKKHTLKMKVIYTIENKNNYETQIRLYESKPFLRNIEAKIEHFSISKSGSHNKENNKLIWQYSLQPNEQQKNHFHYDITYSNTYIIEGELR